MARKISLIAAVNMSLTVDRAGEPVENTALNLCVATLQQRVAEFHRFVKYFVV